MGGDGREDVPALRRPCSGARPLAPRLVGPPERPHQVPRRLAHSQTVPRASMLILTLRITSLDTCSWTDTGLFDTLRAYPGNHAVDVQVSVQGVGRQVYELAEQFDCDAFDSDLLAELDALGFTVIPQEAVA